MIVAIGHLKIAPGILLIVVHFILFVPETVP